MLINLLPAFLSVLDAADPAAAYRKYLENHGPVLRAYWHNYVMDPDSRPAEDLIRQTVAADRADLWALVASQDIPALAEDALARAQETLGMDRPVDCYLMVGMGAANAGELVVEGQGVLFVALEHFTGRANPETFGLGLAPELIPLWIAHECGHLVRYLSPGSRSPLRDLVAEMDGYYNYWETGSRVSLRELLINEGLAVHASQAVCPGLPAPQYFGYGRRQYHRLREMEAFLLRTVEPELDRAALGLRLRYLSGGMSNQARLVGGRVIPERAGYYLGYRMAEALVTQRGIAQALRAETGEFALAEGAVEDPQSA